MDKLRVMFYGDSLTEGYMLDIKDRYTTIFAKHAKKAALNWEIINCGKNGDRIKVTRQRFLSCVGIYQPHVLVLCLGGNDFFAQDTDGVREELEYMIKFVKDKGIKVIIVGQMPIQSECILDLCKRIPALYTKITFFDIPGEVAKKYNLPYIKSIYNGIPPEDPIRLLYKLKNGDLFPRSMFTAGYFLDVVHPNKFGHAVIGYVLWCKLRLIIQGYARLLQSH